MVITEKIYVKTSAGTDILDITPLVNKIILKNRANNGLVNIFIPGSTASVTTMEYEPNLVKDLKRCLENIASSKMEYEHHKTWGDYNGVSHIRATLLGPGITVPFENKTLILGTWQQIVLLDFDTRSRNREIILQIIGE
jgi:secondary thiamine-phosphate synthase enzyme